MSNTCFEWTPEEEWRSAPSLGRNTLMELMALAKNLDYETPPDWPSGVKDPLIEERVPLVIGSDKTSEIFNPRTNTWTKYRL